MISAVSKLYAILNTETLVEPLVLLKRLLLTHVPLIQIRAKNLSDKELLEFSKHALILKHKISRESKIIINDKVEICKEVGADGVHLGQGDESIARARALLGDQAFIGLSTHNLAQVRSAPSELLSYLALGPIFPSSTKSGHAPCVGLDILGEARELTTLPLVAIGGITLENAQSVFAVGADYVAVVGGLEKFL